MYKHHEQSIENMKDYYRKHGAVALILAGSVAKGTERADSDLDGVVKWWREPRPNIKEW